MASLRMAQPVSCSDYTYCACRTHTCWAGEPKRHDGGGLLLRQSIQLHQFYFSATSAYLPQLVLACLRQFGYYIPCTTAVPGYLIFPVCQLMRSLLIKSRAVQMIAEYSSWT